MEEFLILLRILAFLGGSLYAARKRHWLGYSLMMMLTGVNMINGFTLVGETIWAEVLRTSAAYLIAGYIYITAKGKPHGN